MVVTNQDEKEEPAKSVWDDKEEVFLIYHDIFFYFQQKFFLGPGQIAAESERANAPTSEWRQEKNKCEL